MKKSQILNYLKVIEEELTDAYNVTSDTSENSDTLYYIDNARDLINELADNINGKFDNKPVSEQDEFVEGGEYNGMAADGLPLNFPYGDGEGRLKGHN